MKCNTERSYREGEIIDVGEKTSGFNRHSVMTSESVVLRDNKDRHISAKVYRSE